MAKILLLLMLIVLAVVMVVRWQGRQYEAFMQKADKVVGQVVKKQLRTRRPNEQAGQENWLFYTYDVGGKSYEGQERIEYADIWHDITEGQEITVYYNSENPGESHPVVVLDRRLGK